MVEQFIPEKNYFSIGEVSKVTQVKPYILRYWEAEFKLLRPARRVSGQRKYTRQDIELILRIKDLLHNQKYTISGAKRYLLNEKREKNKQLSFPLEKNVLALDFLKEIKKELEQIQKILSSS